jgi:hypothetical protein
MYIYEILFVIGCCTVTSPYTWPFPSSIWRGRGELFRDGMLISVFWKVFSLVIAFMCHVFPWRNACWGFETDFITRPAKDFVLYAVTRFRNVWKQVELSTVCRCTSRRRSLMVTSRQFSVPAECVSVVHPGVDPWWWHRGSFLSLQNASSPLVNVLVGTMVAHPSACTGNTPRSPKACRWQ